MKCFECGALCRTQYIKNLNNKIIAVNKVCSECPWESHPTKIPESFSSRS